MDKIIKAQTEFMEEMLFQYHTVSSSREHEVFGMFPARMEASAIKELVDSARVIDGVVSRVIRKQLTQPESPLFHLPDFPLKDEILKLKSPLDNYHWCRYDGFLREGGGVFFSEFNYDKPCAQREVLFTEQTAKGSLFLEENQWFERDFRESFIQSIETCIKGRKPVIVVMVDPGHLEEAHLGFLYKKLLQDTAEKVILASPRNLVLMENQVLAFGEKVDIILRQFPAEHLHEGFEAEKLLQLHDKGAVKILNDPRWILGQAKSLFGYLWELAEDRSSDLSEEERRVIRSAIPKTELFKPEMVTELCQRKNEIVIKPIFGRYSLDVFIGAMMDDREWEETLKYVTEDTKEYIVQEFCPIRQDVSMRFCGAGYEEIPSYGNIGIYLTRGEYSGCCVRWSTDYLSEDEVVWTTPLYLKSEGPLKVIDPKPESSEEGSMAEKYQVRWEKINEEAAFSFGYTGGWTGGQHSFSIQGVQIDKKLEEELRNATNAMAKLIWKTTEFIRENKDLLFPVLGIPKVLEELVASNATEALCFLGRMDWAVTVEGTLKLLEFNAETPAGVIETLRLSPLIRERYHRNYKDPNIGMEEAIRKSFLKIIKDYGKEKEIKTIGLTASSYYEDWYNLICLAEILKELPFEWVIGEFSALAGDADGLTLCGKPIDAVYRFYPLDWFDGDDRLRRLADGMRTSCHSVNPPGTLISQSKAFFAILWELTSFDFFDEYEIALIKKYVPFTALEPMEKLSFDYISKPLFEREGAGVALSIAGNGAEDILRENIHQVFQERVEIDTLRIVRANTRTQKAQIAYPVIGTYVADREYCGVFLRAGARVTDNWALFMPVYCR